MIISFKKEDPVDFVPEMRIDCPAKIKLSPKILEPDPVLPSEDPAQRNRESEGYSCESANPATSQPSVGFAVLNLSADPFKWMNVSVDEEQSQEDINHAVSPTLRSVLASVSRMNSFIEPRDSS